MSLKDSINNEGLKEFKRNIYPDHGYPDRYEYLKSLAEEYSVNFEAVLDTAEVLGPGEDFDGLVAMIQDFGSMIMEV